MKKNLMNKNFWNLEEIKKEFDISDELEEKLKKEGIINKCGNVSNDYSFMADPSSKKVFKVLKIDSDEYINYIEEDVANMCNSIIENFEKISMILSYPNKLHFKSDIKTFSKLHDMIKSFVFCVDMKNVLMLEEKYGNNFIKEVNKNNIEIESDISKENLEDFFRAEENYYITLLNFLSNDVISRVKSNPKDDEVEKNLLCLLQLYIHMNFINKKIKQLTVFMSEFVPKEKIQNFINESLKSFGYEEIVL